MYPLILLLLIVYIPCYSAIYQSVDPQGNVTFSDQASSYTTIIQSLPPINMYAVPNTAPHPQLVMPNTARAITQTLPSHTNDTKIQQDAHSLDIYTCFSIRSPIDEQTFWNHRQIPVMLTITPKLAKTDRVQMLLDGTPYQDAQSKTEFVLENISRGQHRIQANIINANDEIKKSSQSINIYVHYGGLQTQQDR